MKEHDFCSRFVLTTRQLEQNEHLEIITGPFPILLVLFSHIVEFIILN